MGKDRDSKKEAAKVAGIGAGSAGVGYAMGVGAIGPAKGLAFAAA